MRDVVYMAIRVMAMLVLFAGNSTAPAEPEELESKLQKVRQQLEKLRAEERELAEQLATSKAAGRGYIKAEIAGTLRWQQKEEVYYVSFWDGNGEVRIWLVPVDDKVIQAKLGTMHGKHIVIKGNLARRQERENSIPLPWRLDYVAPGQLYLWAFEIVAPASAQGNDRSIIYTSKTVFHLPVRIEDRYREGLREIHFYVKIGDADWVCQETGKPDVKTFTFRAQQDGEYWFSVATVDLAGQMSPADIKREPPGLRVMVDTTAPRIELQPPSGRYDRTYRTYIQCVIQDANPDYSSLRISYRTAEGKEQALVQDAAEPGMFAVTSGEVWGRAIHVEASDRCGNVTQRDFHIPKPVAQGPVPQVPPAPTPR